MDTDENCAIVSGLTIEYPRIKVCLVAEVNGIARSTVHEIILG
jgi:hypothetical protein